MRKDYDLEDAFAAIEDELIDSMMKNMKRHRIEEVAEEKEWEMWQSLQLKSLEEYKQRNKKKFTSWFSDINGQIEEVIKQANETGHMDQELEILNAIKNGFKGFKKASSTIQAEFFKLNERKLEALIKSVTDDMKKAETAILRMANDQYRKAIFNAQVYANSGAGTYEKAVDMATKDFLAAGLNCVEYANGARHTLRDYADMAIRTASKRAYLQGEGVMRQSWGISTVIVNKRGNPCPKCLPFCGKVLIDDVWSGGKASDGPYRLMSEAIAAGLYHPRCKDSHTTYFEGISTPPDDRYTRADIKKIEDDYREEQKQLYAKRQAEKFERLEKHSLDEADQKRYAVRRKEWEDVVKDNNSSIMELSNIDMRALTKYKSFESYLVNDALRNVNDISELEEDMRQFVKELDEALIKVPTYKGNLVRAVDFADYPNKSEMLDKFLEDFEPGKKIKVKQYWSASKQDGYSDTANIRIYIEKASKGRDISNIGLNEEEVMYERGASFETVSKEFVDGIWYILLKEI